MYMYMHVVIHFTKFPHTSRTLPHSQIVPNVPWYVERRLAAVPLGSLMVMILIKTVQVNITHIRVRHEFSCYTFVCTRMECIAVVHVQYVLYTLAIYGIDIFKRKLVHVGISLRGLVVP